jgi:hypothetical protein
MGLTLCIFQSSFFVFLICNCARYVGQGESLEKATQHPRIYTEGDLTITVDANVAKRAKACCVWVSYFREFRWVGPWH